MSVDAVQMMTVRELLTMLAEVELGGRHGSSESATIRLMESLGDETLRATIDEVDTLIKRSILTGVFYIVADAMGFSRKMAALMAVEICGDLLQAADVPQPPAHLGPLIEEVGHIALIEIAADVVVRDADGDPCDCPRCTELRSIGKRASH